MTAPSSLIIIDPNQYPTNSLDRCAVDQVARAFYRRGTPIIWHTRIDDAVREIGYARPYGDVPCYRIDSYDSAGLKVAVPRPKDRPHFGPAKSRFEQVVKFLRSRFKKTPEPRILRLRDIFENIRAGSSILLAASATESIHRLFSLVPSLRLERPMLCTLHILLTGSDVEHSNEQLKFLVRQLQVGSPIRTVVFHAVGRDVSRAHEDIGVALRMLTLEDCEDDEKLVERFGYVDLETGEAQAPSIAISEFGPIAFHLTALWGRVGSTVIFEAQERYLLSRGFFIVRVFMDHYPQTGEVRLPRIERLIEEDFERVRPHVYFTMERSQSVAGIDELTKTSEFSSASPVLRSTMLLSSGTAIDSQDDLDWLGLRAKMIIVNHLFHVHLAKRLTHAPIALETHDIFSHLLNVHGVPHFVPVDADSPITRLNEERQLWSQVDACVNLSLDEHEEIAQFAKMAVIAKPYVERTEILRRSWPQAVALNKLSERFETANEFDIMLWGSGHGGNVASIDWFVKEVLAADPRFEEIKVVIVGRVTEWLPKSLACDERLFFAGFVDNLDDFVARSKVLVIPDIDGTGISIKAMEAFALAACFASTRVGVRGIDLTGVEYAPCLSAEEFADDIADLLASPQARVARAEAALRLYETNFSFEAYQAAWDKVTATIVPSLSEGIRSTVELAVVEQPPPGFVRRPSLARQSVIAAAESGPDPRMTVVVCTHNRYNMLPDAIDSLLRQDLNSGSLEIIVVDNSSNQKAAATFAQRYENAPLRYLLESVQGLSNARNVGAKNARSAIVAYIDDDAIAAPQWAKHMLEAFDRYGLDRAGIVGGRVVPLWIHPKPDWLSEELVKNLSVIDWGGELRELSRENYLVGCNIAYNRVALLEAGGFSRALGRNGSGAVLLSNEEIEVTEKIHASGYSSFYAPDAMVEHVIDPGRLSRSWFRRRAAWQAVSDMVKDPHTASKLVTQAEQHLRWAEKPGNRKVPVSFFSEQASGQEFEDDMGLIYNLVIATLCGGASWDDPTGASEQKARR